MSKHVLHQEEDEATGLILKIIVDEDLDNPYADDCEVRIVVLHGRYVNPAADTGLISVEAVAEFEAENAPDDSPWITFPLWLFDHSTNTYAVAESIEAGNPFGSGMYASFDSGRVGIVAISRAAFYPDTPNDHAKLFEAAQGVARAYTDYANGNGWGYVIEDAHGDQLDACWGYLGDWNAENSGIGEVRESFQGCIAEALAAKAKAEAQANAETAAELQAARPDLYGAADA